MEGEATFPMRVVERLTGLTAATIRAWERRYDAVVPERTAGNARRYSAEDVRRLVLLRKAVERGHSIAGVACLSESRLRTLADERVEEEPVTSRGRSPLLDDYMSAVREFESRRAMDILARAAALLPPVELVFELVVPLLRETGDGWSDGSLTVAHEHFVSNQMRWLLSLSLRQQTPRRSAARLLVATPPGEQHEFGIMVGAFQAASRGLEPVYLGTEVPWADLCDAAEQSGASIAIVALVHRAAASELRSFQRGVERLAETLEVWIGLPEGHPATRRKLAGRVFHRYEDLDAALLARFP